MDLASEPQHLSYPRTQEETPRRHGAAHHGHQPVHDTDDDTRQVQMLYRRINKLGPLDKAIVLLWLENLSYDEIGQIIGISTKNVSVKLVRIKEQLKKMSND